MNIVRQRRRRPARKALLSIPLVVLAAFLLLSGADHADAQDGSAAKAGQDTKQYVLPYTVVVLAVGLGVFVVCRPTHRAESERQDYFGATPKGMRGEEFHHEG